MLCDLGNVKKTRKRLQQAAKALTQYTHRLAGHAARKKLDATLRQTLSEAGASIGSELKTLRTQVQCPSP